MNINFYSSIDKLKKFNLSTKSIAIFLTAVTMVSATAGWLLMKLLILKV